MVAPKDSAKLQRPEAVLHILLRDGSVTEREIAGDEVKIGKGPQNDIILSDASVSSTHAMISFEDGGFKISDLGSRNGTLLNDARVTEPRPIQHGDLIKMGHCTLTFRLKEAGDTLSMQRTQMLDPSQPPPAPPAPPTPKPAILSEDALAAALISSGLVAQSEVERLRKQDARGRRLYRALIEEKLATEIGLRDLMSRTFNIPAVELKTMEIEATAAKAMRQQFLRERLVCPVVTQPDHLALAMADPTDRATAEEAERVLRKKVSLRLALPSEIVAQIDAFFTPRLVGVMPTGEKVEAVLNQHETEIGKATHNRVVLSDPTVSSTHAIVLAQEGGYNIVDLGSSNGTFVNGRKLGNESHALQHGDKIQLGQALLTFRNPAETVENKTARLSLEALEEIRRRAMTRNLSSMGQLGAQPGVRTDPSSWTPPNNLTGAPLPGSRAGVSEGIEEKKEKKKDKDKDKDKDKKKKDERLKAAWVGGISRIVAQVMGVLLTVGLTVYLLNRDPGGKHLGGAASSSGGSGAAEVSGGKTPLVQSDTWKGFSTGLFGGAIEASGVAHPPGAAGVLVVSDNYQGEVLWMPLGEDGKQAGSLKKIPLNVSFMDPEAVTYGGSFFYLVTSQSDPRDGQKNALVRFDINPDTQALRGQPEIITDLRSFLLQNVTAIASLGSPPGTQGGLNIEGIAWDPNNERLLLGLRSPQIGAQAVLIPIKLRDPRGPFKIENLKIDEPNVIVLSLGGQGVRDITYDSHLKNFLIISGAPETSPKTDFGLWEWNGQHDGKPIKVMTLDDTRKPEGISNVTIGGRAYAFVVGDAGSYLRLDYK
jgi:pSer/pThr/pTyr-binding forkhead associated (FHA) protein